MGCICWSLTGNLPYPASRHLRTLTGTALLLPQQPQRQQGEGVSGHGNAAEWDNLLPSVPGEQSLSWDERTRRVLCSPATVPSLLEERTCNWFFPSFRCEHSGKGAQQVTATNCPAQENPERSHWQNKRQFCWSEPTTASEEWSA